MIIGIVGFIGTGKDTIADYLVNIHQFRRESFANTLKDAVAIERNTRGLKSSRRKKSRGVQEPNTDCASTLTSYGEENRV
jgi:dephospho-CoA kinase